MIFFDLIVLLVVLFITTQIFIPYFLRLFNTDIDYFWFVKPNQKLSGEVENLEKTKKVLETKKKELVEKTNLELEKAKQNVERVDSV